MYFASFEDQRLPASVGNKFFQLALVRRLVRVPQAICVTVECLRDHLTADLREYLQSFFEETKATLGCHLIEAIGSLSERLEPLDLREPIRRSLAELMRESFGSLEPAQFAVRSSALDEDSVARSAAGLYASYLNVAGFDSLCDAIVACWKSYYQYRAVSARVRMGMYDPDPGIAVIVQQMVDPVVAGVAMSDGDSTVHVEYVPGLADRLVSGVARATRVTLAPWEDKPTENAPILEEVRATAIRLRNALQRDVDIEWAWDKDGLSVVQCRPVTARLAGFAASGSHFRVKPLYGGLETFAPGELGDVREIAEYYVRKRANAYRLAARFGVQTGNAHIVSFNGAGLIESERAHWEALLAATTPDVVLDVSRTLRQVIIPRKEVREYLLRTFGGDRHGYHSVVCRDYIRGRYGFVSSVIDGGTRLLIEYSTEGLLKINRGTAHTNRLICRVGENGGVALVNDELADGFETSIRDSLGQVFRFTRVLGEQCGASHVEWVLDSNQVFFIDFSRSVQAVPCIANNLSICIYAGLAEGPALVLQGEDMFDRLSVGPAVSVGETDSACEHHFLNAVIRRVRSYPRKPVVISPKPYAILSTIFDDVAGFVFLEGALLCHLSILLREHRIAAVICPDIDVEDGGEVIVSGSCVRVHR